MSYKRFKEVAALIISGVFFYLAFSKWSLWFFIFPYLFLLSNFRSARAWIGTGILSFLLSLMWVRIAMIDYGEVFPPVAYSLILLLVSFLALFQFGVSYLLWKAFKYSPIALPFLWVGVEVARSNIPYGGFPWLLVGELSVDIPLIKNYLSAGGVYLTSLLLWFLALSPKLFRKKRDIAVLLLIAITPIPFIENDYKEPKGLKVAIIQPNVQEHIKLDKEKFYRYLPQMWELLDEALKEDPHIVFLPESAFPFTANKLHSEGKKLLEASRQATIVTGLIDIRFIDRWQPYNSVFVIRNGKVIDFYDKVRLLPFGEYVPFPFGFVKDIFGAIGGTDYVPGSGARCLETHSISIATPICFEVSYYQLIRKLTRCAELIAVLTNDGWFRDSNGTFQHLRQARVRAVETRKFVLWVNNTGPSALIDPLGRIIKTLPYGQKGYIIYSF